MFDDIIKELDKIEKTQVVSADITPDENGYIDRECPSEKCLFTFKVNDEDWGNIFKDEVVYCPLCRHDAPAKDWYTQKQIKHIENEAYEMISGQVQTALKTGARRSNLRNRSSNFLSMTLKVSGPYHRSYILPVPASKTLQLEIKCKKCSARFAVLGSAYFCPACGFNSVKRTFDDSIEKIKSKINSLDTIRLALKKSVGPDQAEISCRSITESCIQDAIVALQRLSEELYKKAVNETEAPFNAFQRIKQSSELWKTLYNKGYEDWLSKEELFNLNVLYNKRHLLAHREGIVDDKYLKSTNDTSYKVEQRIVIKKNDINELIRLVCKIASKIKELTYTP